MNKANKHLVNCFFFFFVSFLVDGPFFLLVNICRTKLLLIYTWIWISGPEIVNIHDIIFFPLQVLGFLKDLGHLGNWVLWKQYLWRIIKVVSDDSNVYI